MNIMENYDNATPEEKKEIDRKMHKQILRQVTLFVGLKVALAIGTHLLLRKLAKSLDDN